MSDLRITARTSIPDSALSLRFVRASGPGGQNVNKVASAVELRLDLRAAGLPEPVLARLRRIAARRISAEDVLVIFAQSYRTQARNREDAMSRLATLIEQAERIPKKRIATRPTRASRERRMDTKRQKGQDKRLRRKPATD